MRRCIYRFALASLFVSLAGFDCAGSEPETQLEPGSVLRQWEFAELSRNGGARLVGPPGVQVDGTVSEDHVYGPMVIFPPEVGQDATAEVFSNENGFTYWVSTQAPHVASPAPTAIAGSQVALGQVQHFRKTDADATLTFKVTRSLLDVIDSNGNLPSALECPWRAGSSFADCARVMNAWVELEITARRLPDGDAFFGTGGTLELFGWTGAFDFSVHNGRGRRLWSLDDVAFDPDVTGTGGTRAQLGLAREITIAVPLTSLSVGQDFAVVTTAGAGALNLRQRESYLSAFFRDPVAADGLEMSYTGLTPLETPTTPPAHAPPSAAPACTGPVDPEAGTLALAARTSAHAELPGLGAPVVVERVGGTRGQVSARLVTSNGSATDSDDYTAVDTHVVFDDGEGGERTIRVPIRADGAVESDETITVTLSDARGCAALGSATSATLVLQDDDETVGAATFTVGGEVTGLLGSGLVLREVRSGFDLSVAADGPFTFDYRHPDGSDYEVRVATQPQEPFQVCAVTGGSGSIAGADVTDVAVSCTSVIGNGALDPGFGEGGKVTGAFDDIVAVTVQADGKIVAAGDRTLRRFLADGSPDAGFGEGGAVTVDWGGIVQQINAVAVQPDGKIVVAGQNRSASTSDDFAVARFTASGTLDDGFGSGGEAVLDLHGFADRAMAVMIAADGGVILAGHGATPSTVGTGNDFAVVRYSASGVLDDTFGKVMVNIGGNTDLAAAAALAPDGKIVIVGRVAQGGGDDPDIGIVRLDPSGARDAGFGDSGVVRHAAVAGWDEATDVAVGPDGAIVVAVKAFIGPTFELAAARFTAAGAPDGSFGAGGFVHTAFSDQNDFAAGVALDGSGRVILVGQQSNLNEPDFAIARYTTSGALDDTFGAGGTLGVDFFSGGDVAECVAVQADGKIVVGGVAQNGAGFGGALIRVLP